MNTTSLKAARLSDTDRAIDNEKSMNNEVKDVDDCFVDVSLPPSWTAAEEAAVQHKIDLRVIPTVTALYLVCFLDRVNVGNARIEGMDTDLQLSVGVRFNIVLTMFYITYALSEVPSNILLKHIGGRFYIPSLVVCFGVVCMCTAFCTSFASLCVARAVLGLCEGGMFPGISFYLSCFYKRDELFLRLGWFVSGAGLAGAFGGLLAAGLSYVPTWGSKHAVLMTPWRNIFFFEGVLTILVGVLCFRVLPNVPSSAGFLTERERMIAEHRLSPEKSSRVKVSRKHIIQAITAPHNYICIVAFCMINVTMHSVSVFMPTILHEFQWPATRSQLLSAAPYAVSCVATMGVAWLSDRTKRRGIFCVATAPLGIVGFSILRWYEGTPWMKYAAMFFILSGTIPNGPLVIAWALNNSEGAAVRAVSSAYVMSLSMAGGFIATWIYTVDDAPKYSRGHSINLSCQFILFSSAVIGILYCKWENVQRERGRRDWRLEGLSEEEKGELGSLHPEFRYMP
ncbi:hypothetical protein TD95_002705 [Thielaviopsis punctulata]|uniref:Major facilitator superfamily (MFS) profile domain-containing protein n=1 Tax=Thielaviopsis punctulata TaxID=72032 RepID=A0A0F4Z664_9PEZI|nr:hypothetical protein TD95_002705 [Thielaviopsis punctulata]